MIPEILRISYMYHHCLQDENDEVVVACVRSVHKIFSLLIAQHDLSLSGTQALTDGEYPGTHFSKIAL